MYNINVVSLRMQHHAGPSGYDKLLENLEVNVIAPRVPAGFGVRSLIKLMARITKNSGSFWYHRQNMHMELLAAQSWLSSNSQIYHFLYGENSYRYLGNLKSFLPRDNKIICSYHTPTWRMKEVVKDRKHIEKLDAIAVVSTVQSDFFSELIGPERVYFVPHGVDTDYFTPGATELVARPDRIRFVTVGHHLRDFNTLAAVAKQVGRTFPEVEFIVVARADRMDVLRNLSNVKCLSGISDEDLKMLYCTSSALFLPLEDATANNSLLEAMACGLPIISTDIAGVRDYVPEQNVLLCARHDTESCLNAVLQVCEESVDLNVMGKASRMAALRFSWPLVSKQMNELYSRVAICS